MGLKLEPHVMHELTLFCNSYEETRDLSNKTTFSNDRLIRKLRTFIFEFCLKEQEIVYNRLWEANLCIRHPGSKPEQVFRSIIGTFKPIVKDEIFLNVILNMHTITWPFIKEVGKLEREASKNPDWKLPYKVPSDKVQLSYKKQ